MQFKEVRFTLSFQQDLKRLSKKFRTLDDDLQNFIKTQLVLCHKLHLDNDGVKEIPGVKKGKVKIFKAKKFACKSLKGRGAKSGIRIIYSYLEEKDVIDLIEIYFKADKELENRDRIKDSLSSIED